ncbi:BapA/Bap/LapF family large adhesin [Sphingomonas sp. Y38-1Y]|uniref:BapA/Bap/LapF family large adhesin n=1 Tax=Sphingomonas sp. Y38-1Y TaxID=3078265 RepID=UPI0028EABCCA|nr:BapA/Bap/LapF family large adhesin [Sphingomonas sp. Y38-1Y]
MAADGRSVTGTGEPGATLTIRDAAGAVIGTGIVAADGSYSVAIDPAQVNGEIVFATQTDAAGNASEPTPATAPDLTAPDAPVAILSPDGTVVTGTGEPNTTVQIRGPGGVLIGTGIVGADGNYTVTLTPAQTNGEAISVTLTDAAGNVSDPTPLTAPDTTAPDAPDVAIAPDGTALTGTGEPGATIIVRDATGNEIASGVVGADGTVNIPLAPPLADGEVVTAVQTDPAGNVSDPVRLVAPDITAPPAPEATVAPDGASISGTGVPGAIITITDADGNLIGRVRVGADGTFLAPLVPAQVNGEALSVVQSDAAGNASPPLALTAPDLTAPEAPTATIDDDGTTLTGTGEPGATIEVRAADGTIVGTGTVGADGSFTLTLTPAQADGGALSVTQADAAGNVSPPATVVTPDLTAPEAPVAAIDATGTIVSGTGEPGATITVRGPDGAVLGTAIVNAAGAYSVTLTTPQLDSQELSVVQSDAAGNESGATSVVAPDLTAPDAPVATVSADGALVTGTGEAGTTVRILDPVGQLIGTGTVNPDGSFSIAIAPAQVNGETLSVRLTDAAGNVSAPATPTAPDLVPNDSPDAPTATVSADGTAVSGTGEPNAAVIVRDPDGVTIGTGTVQADGSYTIVLDVPQLDGETLSVVQVRPGGAASPPAFADAPDLTAPEAPTAELVPSGEVVTGTGEPGATITVRAADGTVLGTATVNAAGNYAATLSSAQQNGETLTVIQTDGAGNASPPIPLVAPDVTAPAVPTLAIADDGATATGTGEPGATITIRDPAGVAIGTAIVAADGSYSAPLSPAQTNGEQLTATQADAAGNVSPEVSAPAPDLTAPDAPTAAVSPEGTLVAGTGEPGATITIRDAVGNVVATGTVGTDGRFAIPLDPPIVTGEALSVVQADAAGNASPPATAATPDLTPPEAPEATIAPDGASVSGTGEPGATVTIVDDNGVPLGSAIVAADGSFTVPLDPALADGETLIVRQQDAAGNLSPATSLTAADTTAPGAPTATIAEDGSVVTGTGEPGATVRIVDAAGTLVGTAVVGADGSYQATLDPAQRNGEQLSATQTDTAGNTSASIGLLAPDLTAPGAPVAEVSDDGTALTGTGEPGALVRVTDALGNLIATGIVGADGSFSIPLTPAQANGETLTVVQVDAGGNASPSTSVTAPDITAPAAPTADVSDDGTVATGRGEPGATVTVTDAAGNVIATAPVAADGSYSVPLAPPLLNGEIVTVVQTDVAGNDSPATSVTAPDETAPEAPVATITDDGTALTGTGEPGATVTVTDPAGNTVATGTVGADGSFTLPLQPPLANGETVTVVQTDAGGNASPTTSVTAPDITAPAAPSAEVADDGTAVTGTGEPGATVTVRDAEGNVIATAPVATDGSYSVPLVPPLLNGETVTVVQTDPAGNDSPGVDATAPDETAPAAPAAEISEDGGTITGTGEPGATVTVRAGDTVLGTATVAADGSYSVPLTPPQIDGQDLTVTQADAAGNVSPGTPVEAPDYNGPPAPTAEVSDDGALVTGTGTAGSTITVIDVDGTVLGTGPVAADGSFSIQLTPPQIEGDLLTVRQADSAGNQSPPVSVLSPDLTAPEAPTATVSDDGLTVTGTGEAGATIEVRAPDGSSLGTTTVLADGSYSVTLTTPQLASQVLTVDQTDPAGNTSPSVNATAPDLTAPEAPTATVSDDGLTVTGTGEAGATIEVRAADGSPLGTTTVLADGSYSVTLTTPQLDSQVLTVDQTDPAGNTSPSVNATAPDLTAPEAPIATVSPDGLTVTGTGEAGATIEVRAPDGSSLGMATVLANGTYTVTLTTPQLASQVLTVDQTDPAGNTSPSVTTTAPDLTAPEAPTATVSPDGLTVTGTGEAGATIEVRAPDGSPLGTTTVLADGSYSVTLTTPQLASQVLTVDQTDTAGNTSPSVNTTAPDLTAPEAPTATVSPDGLTVTGTGEAGATIEVRAPDGSPLGTTTVLADGSYSVTLTTPQLASQVLTVDQTDPAGNTSPSVTTTAPDLTAPEAPTATVSPDGLTVTGTGEAGATIEVRDPAGTVVATTVVLGDGSYSAALNPPQDNGGVLSVTQEDAAGNVSPEVDVPAPDITAPAAPTDLAVEADGTTLTGRGEAGASVEVTDASGDVIGIGTVNPDGSFSVELVPPQTGGDNLNVVLIDGAGNDSLPGIVSAPIDIDAFDNVNSVQLDVSPTSTPVELGAANYTVLLSLGLIDLSAQVLAVPTVNFSVATGHTLDASFTYDAVASIGVASNYRVVVQRLEGGQWVSLEGTPGGSLLELGVLAGDLNATADLGPGQYRAFVAFQGVAGLGLLGALEVSGIDNDFTRPIVDPETATGNVVTDPGPGGEVDIVGAATVVESVTVGGVTTAVAAGGTSVRGTYGTLTINPDGSYSYVPDASAAGIGRSDSFTYTLLDPTDNERESANLTINIGSDDVAAPVATNDQASVTASYDYLVTTPTAVAGVFFDTPGTLALPVTRSQTGTFTVAANDQSDVTISAIRGGNVALLPSYTITVRDAAGVEVGRVTGLAVVGPLSTGLSLTVPDLDPGTYSYTISSTNIAGTGYTTTSQISQTITNLDQFDFDSATTATGNILANDVDGGAFASLRIESGTGFTPVGNATVKVDGDYGRLFIDADGDYRYVVDADLAYAPGPRVDSFTYEIVQPGGQTATATLDITIASATPATAPALTAEFGILEEQGELETVLARYLDEQGTQEGQGLHPDAPAPEPAAIVHDPVDPFAYIDQQTYEEDRHHLGPV